MQITNVLRAMLARKGISAVSAARLMKRSDSYISRRISGNQIPKVDSLAEIGNVLGFDLLLRDRQDGFEILIDPPER